MKNILVIALAMSSLSLNAAKNPSSTSIPSSIIQKSIVKEGNAFPSFIKIDPQQSISLEKFKSILLSYHESDKWSIQEEKRTTDEIGYTHITYNQYYNNTLIDLTKYHVHIKEGKVISANGNFVSDTPLSSTPLLSNTQSLNAALQHINADVYKWELPEEEAHIKMETNDPKATFYPSGELVLLPTDNNYSSNIKAAWKFNVYAHQPLSRQWVYVDAINGDILLENDLIHHTDVQGTAVTGYSGVRTITTDSVSPGNYRLRETTRGNGVITLNMQGGTSYGNAVDFTDSDNYWNNVNAQQDEIATDAHWGAEVTYDYYDDIHNRNSIDGNGFTLYSYVHYDVAYANAFWDGQRMTYGDGDGSISALTALDIAGHEVSHGLTNFTANLVYQNESGALNESFSDIFGTAIEFYGKPNLANWNMGEDIGSAFRSMSNPGLYNDPDTYLGNNWFTGTADNGGVHTNSGVQNKWFYILSQGESGVNDLGDAYNVSGIGIIDASKIAFRNLTVYLTPSSNYQEARFYAIQSAIDLFGECSPEVEATTDAWYAVGVGQAYVPYVLSDFIPNIDESCQAPLTVQFNNTSINGINFQWSFGDGNSSTDLAPTNTYTNNGYYAVTLIADGGSCGIDTTVIDSAIKIGPDVPCNVILPSNGTAPLQTACSGKIYDSGGPTGNYSDNEFSSITISPAGASTITLNFPQFDIEPGSGNTCNYDYLEVFDGATSAANSLGQFCNTTGNPGTIVSTGGSVTIVFNADQGLNMSGFEIEWQCSFPNVAPTVDFSVNKEESCSGEVKFSDQTLFGPNQWQWDFGDGNTSTLQNPTHTYAQNGFYTVSLTASNSVGSNTEVKTSYVNINMPSTPTLSGAQWACLNQPDTIFANSTGITRWYDASGNNVIHEGDSLITPNVTGTLNFYTQTIVQQPVQNVGPGDNTFGGGGNFNNYQYLIFDVYDDMVLQSVLVYSGADADRIIELRDNQGQVLESKTVFIPTGEQRVELEFQIPPGTDYQLGLNQNTTFNLFRNNSGVSFPYTINDLVSITQSSANTNPVGYYYFFYDWEVREKDCASEKELVQVEAIDCSTGMEENLTANNVKLFPNPVVNELQIEVTGITTSYTVQILDVTGKTILDQEAITAGTTNFSIDMNSYSKGIYTFRIIKQNSTYNQLIIKQ